jgi:hypothetical protein
MGSTKILLFPLNFSDIPPTDGFKFKLFIKKLLAPLSLNNFIKVRGNWSHYIG